MKQSALTTLKDRALRALLRVSLRMRASAAPAPSELALFEPDLRCRTALVMHFDATQESILALMDDTRNLRQVFQRVVYVTDFADFSTLREHDCIFEFVPPRRQQMRHGDPAAWGDFLSDRHELLVAKWTPQTVLSFGTSFEDIVDRAKISFETSRNGSAS